MSDRTDIARAAAAALRAFSQHTAQTPVMIGFDGYVDLITAVVETRHDAERYDRIEMIEQFGARVVEAAGQSANFELVTTLEKLGGNGPIMANAMASLALPVTYIGAIGSPAIHPVFQDLANRADCISIAGPGVTHALEFADGKLLMGKYDHMLTLNFQSLLDTVGRERLEVTCARSRLIGMINWTMMNGVTDIWRRMTDELLSDLPAIDGGRRVFIDLCDPSKRSRDELIDAMGVLTKMQQHVNVTLGLNLSEATQVAGAFGVDPTRDPEAAAVAIAEGIRDVLSIDTVVVHPRSSAAAAGRDTESGTVCSATFDGPYVQQPQLSTGAGDNFNAGFCLGQLAGMPIEQALCTGTAMSGYYVRHAGSPTLAQLADFCDALPAPEA